jgi:hypothetical protein
MYKILIYFIAVYCLYVGLTGFFEPTNAPTINLFLSSIHIISGVLLLSRFNKKALYFCSFHFLIQGFGFFGSFIYIYFYGFSISITSNLDKVYFLNDYKLELFWNSGMVNTYLILNIWALLLSCLSYYCYKRLIS